MAQLERDRTIINMEQKAHEGLGRWVESHLGGIITEIPYRPENENQWIDRVELEPSPSLESARRIGEVGMGLNGYSRLVSDFQKAKIVETVVDNSTRNISTLIATLHLNDTLDTAITHNALFVASGNPEFAKINVVLANYIMSRMAIGGIAVDEVLSYSGRQIRALPEAAAEFIEPEIRKFMGSIAIPRFTKVLREGVALHRAPSGTRGKRIILSDGSPALMVPRVDDNAAQTIRKRTPIAVGVPMNVEVGNSSAHVLSPRKIESDQDLHFLMEEMVDAANDLFDEQVVYGLPKGAQLA